MIASKSLRSCTASQFAGILICFLCEIENVICDLKLMINDQEEVLRKWRCDEMKATKDETKMVEDCQALGLTDEQMPQVSGAGSLSEFLMCDQR